MPCGECILNSQCNDNQKGIFVEVRYFQLHAVDVHEDVKSRYLRQVTEAAEEERAQFQLQEKVMLLCFLVYLSENVLSFH